MDFNIQILSSGSEDFFMLLLQTLDEKTELGKVTKDWVVEGIAGGSIHIQ